MHANYIEYQQIKNYNYYGDLFLTTFKFRLYWFIPKICNDMPLSHGFYTTMIQPSKQSNYLWFFSGYTEILGGEGS